MAEISKLKLPNGDEYDLKVSVEHISGQVPISSGGTGANSALAARQNLGLGTAATYDATNVVENNTDLPTGTAVKTRVSNHVVVSSTQPTNQIAGDIWMIISDSPNAYDQGDLATYGSATQEASS